jgi:hypothetical protein
METRRAARTILESQSMHVTLHLDPARLWRWHLMLIEAWERTPNVSISVTFATAAQPNPSSLTHCLDLEATLSGAATPNPCDALKPDAFARWRAASSTPPDLTVDLATHGLSSQATRTLTPLYDGQPGEAAFWSALLDGRAPALALNFDGGTVAIGQPAIESPHALRTSANAVLTRLITSIIQTANTPRVANRTSETQTPASPAPSSAALSLLTRKVASKATRLLERTLKTAPQWAVAYHHGAPASRLPAPNFDIAAFAHLPDDGQRYYADPFLFARHGQIDLFVEELPYATGRGIISVTSFNPDGTLKSAPRPVLETPFHLSYPHIFERDGTIWMLPEASASGGLTLYRAARYPDQWEPVAQLIDEPLHDATLFEHGSKLWIAACTQGEPLGPNATRYGSCWDALSLYSADTLLGPWQPHSLNPVLLDAKTARPAGEVFSEDGALYRPVQDCATGYGTATGFARITKLTTKIYQQELTQRLAFPANTGLSGPHTWNTLRSNMGNIDAIDLFAPSRVIAAVGKRDRRTL